MRAKKFAIKGAGQVAFRYAWNTACDHCRVMLREYATAHGLPVAFSLLPDRNVTRRDPKDHYNILGGERVWRHDQTGQEFVFTLERTQ